MRSLHRVVETSESSLAGLNLSCGDTSGFTREAAYTHETGEVVFAEATGKRQQAWDHLGRLEAASNTQQCVTAQSTQIGRRAACTRCDVEPDSSFVRCREQKKGSRCRAQPCWSAGRNVLLDIASSVAAPAHTP